MELVRGAGAWMTEPRTGGTTAGCSCAGVELELRGAPPVLEPDGGTAYVLYRKDRMQCSKGAELLRDYRLNENSPTRRVVAACCNSAMFVDFQKGHWFSVYRARLRGEVPALQMRIQTRFAPRGADVPHDAPGYARYPLKFIFRLLGARVAMLLRR